MTQPKERIPIPTVNWNPVTYDRLAMPHRDWAAEIVRQLPISTSDCIMDAGCGTGYMTAMVAERVPDGSVIAVDICEPMLAFGIESGKLKHPHIRVLCADLLDLPLHQEIDGIFSNAVFHWILDQRMLFSSLFDCLKDGGWLVAQAGGGPNMSSLLQDVYALQRSSPYAPYFADWNEPWTFVNEEEMRNNLLEAGFDGINVTLEARPVQFGTVAEYCQYLREIVLRPYLAKLPPELQEAFLNVLGEYSRSKARPLEVDYCRVNLSARKPML